MLRIDDEFGIRADDTCVSLIRFSIVSGENVAGRAPDPKNIGKERESPAGYYANVRQALIAYLEKSSRADEAATSVQGLIGAIDRAVARVEAAASAIAKAVKE